MLPHRDNHLIRPFRMRIILLDKGSGLAIIEGFDNLVLMAVVKSLTDFARIGVSDALPIEIEDDNVALVQGIQIGNVPLKRHWIVKTDFGRRRGNQFAYVFRLDQSCALDRGIAKANGYDHEDRDKRGQRDKCQCKLPADTSFGSRHIYASPLAVSRVALHTLTMASWPARVCTVGRIECWVPPRLKAV